MNIVFFFIVLLIGFLILKNRNDYKRLKIYLIGIVFVPFAITYPTTGLYSHRFFTVCFFASLLFHKKNGKQLFLFPCIIPFLFLAISHYCTAFFDFRISLFHKIWKPTIIFIESFGLLLLGYFTVLKVKDWEKLKLLFFNIFAITTLYALITFIIKSDPFSLLITSYFPNENGDFNPDIGQRLRITSFFYNSHIYGFFCSISIIIVFYYMIIKRDKSRYEICTFILLIINVLLSGSRSSILGAGIGIIIMVVLITKLKRTIIIGLFVCFILISIFQMPYMQNKFSFIHDMFSIDGGNTGGSNLGMRALQLDISLYIFSFNPIWGNGMDYLNEVIAKDDTYRNAGLLGAESYLFLLLIERGIIQIICILIYFTSLFTYFKRRLSIHRQEYALAIALLVVFIFNSIVTGNGYKWSFVMPIIGLFLNRQNVDALATLKK